MHIYVCIHILSILDEKTLIYWFYWIRYEEQMPPSSNWFPDPPK